MEQGAWQQQGGGADNVPRLRPLDIGQKIDAAIKLTTRNFGTLATIVLLVAGPVQLLSVLTTLSTVPEDYTVGSGDFGGGTATPENDLDASTGFWVGQVIVVLLGMFVYLLTTAGCFKAIGHAYLGDRTTWQDSLSYGLKRLHSVLWVSTLVFLATLLGVLALIVGSIYVAIAFSLALPVLLLEGRKGTKALGRSHELVKGRWWRTFGVLFAGYILGSVVAGIVQGILAALMFVAVGDDSALSIVLSSLAGLAGQVITTPFVAALVTVVYFDLRVRKEAFDLQVLAEAMGGRAPTEAMAAKPMPWFAPPGWGQQPGWGAPQQPGWQQQQQWGAPQQQQGWGQPPGQPPGGQQWGQAPPGGGQWGPPAPPGGGYGTPPGHGAPPQEGQPAPGYGAPPQKGQPAPGYGSAPPQPPQRWEPPAPPQNPPVPPQQWEPPAPPDPPGPPEAPRPPDPPDRSSS